MAGAVAGRKDSSRARPERANPAATATAERRGKGAGAIRRQCRSRRIRALLLERRTCRQKEVAQVIPAEERQEADPIVSAGQRRPEANARAVRSGVLDVVRRAHQDLDDLRLGAGVTFKPLACCLAQIGDRGADHLRQAGAVAVVATIGAAHPRHLAADGGEPVEHHVDDVAVRLEIALALGRDAVELLAALALGGEIARLFEIGERGINDTRARAVPAARLLLDHLDDLVAVTRLFRDQGKHEQLQVSLCQHAADTEEIAAARPAPAAPAETGSVTAMAMTAGGPMGTARVAVTSHSKHVSLLLDIAIDITVTNISFDISKCQEARLNGADSSAKNRRKSHPLTIAPRQEAMLVNRRLREERGAPHPLPSTLRWIFGPPPRLPRRGAHPRD